MLLDFGLDILYKDWLEFGERSFVFILFFMFMLLELLFFLEICMGIFFWLILVVSLCFVMDDVVVVSEVIVDICDIGIIGWGINWSILFGFIIVL